MRIKRIYTIGSNCIYGLHLSSTKYNIKKIQTNKNKQKEKRK